jgi:hypothetical protein
LPHCRCPYLRRNTNIVQRSMSAGARRERHMSLIEKREVQQLYDEIMRRPKSAFRR